MVQLRAGLKHFMYVAPIEAHIKLINVLVITRQHFIIISFFAQSVNKNYDILFALRFINVANK